MMRLAIAWTLVGGMLTFASACGSDVSVGSTADSGATAGKVDQRCYAGCIERGGSESECVAACSTNGGAGAGSPGGTTIGSGAGHSGGPGGGVDKMAERHCYWCMEESANGPCSAEHEACEASLACKMLKVCPYECDGKSGCVEECKSIIPSGVDTLGALVQCLLCDGGPCAVDCKGSVMELYCH